MLLLIAPLGGLILGAGIWGIQALSQGYIYWPLIGPRVLATAVVALVIALLWRVTGGRRIDKIALPVSSVPKMLLWLIAALLWALLVVVLGALIPSMGELFRLGLRSSLPVLLVSLDQLSTGWLAFVIMGPIMLWTWRWSVAQTRTGRVALLG